MKLAIPVLQDNGRLSQISEHFGRAPFFAIVTANSAGQWNVQIERNPAAADHMPGQVPQYIISKGVDILITRGIGGRAIQHFENSGIKVIRGAEGTLEEIVNQYLAGKLTDKDYQVSEKHHHDHGHH